VTGWLKVLKIIRKKNRKCLSAYKYLLMKKVTFQKSELHCLEITGIEPPVLSCTKNSKKKWYTQNDYEAFAIERDYYAFKIRKNGKDKLLDSVLPCGENPLIDTKTLESKLYEWAELDYCRGLEMKVNRAHRCQRMEEQRRAICAVLKMQTRLKGDEENYLEKLRETSEKYSVSATLFARAIADADEKAVQGERKPLLIRQPSMLQRLIRVRIRKLT
jgi:hypothetical protein